MTDDQAHSERQAEIEAAFASVADAMSAAPEPAPQKEPEMATNPFTTTTETMHDQAHAAMAQGTAGFEQMSAKAREAMEQSMQSLTELSGFAKGNIEAMVASAKSLTAGVEQMAQTATEHGRAAFEQGTSAAKAMAAAKTPQELMQLHQDFTKTQFDSAVKGWSTLSESMLKLAGEAFEPISNRLAIAADHIKQAMPKA